MPELTPEESHARAKERARAQRLTRLRATLDEIARARATPQIQFIVDRLVRDGGDVPIRVLPTVRDKLPEICRDRSIAQVAPMIVDVHIEHVMTRDEMSGWIQYLTSLGRDLHAKGWPSPPPKPPVRITRGSGPGILSDFALAPLPPIAPALPPRDPWIPADEQAAINALPPRDPRLPPEDEASLLDLAP